MNSIKKKLRSKKGASITFALLIFLVCAVVTSVLIVASTTVSGRISKEAESDQRYYCVTSAAELLKDMINGKSASVIKVEESRIVTTYPDSGTPSSVQSNPVETTYVVEKAADGIDEDTDLVEDNSVGDDFTMPESILKEAAYDYYKHRNDTPPGKGIRDLTITSEITSEVEKKDGVSPLDAYVNVEVYYSTGDMKLIVYNSSGNPYKLCLSFQADVKEDRSEKNDEGPHVPTGDGSGYTVQTDNTTVTSTSITWELMDIKTLTV